MVRLKVEATQDGENGNQMVRIVESATDGVPAELIGKTIELVYGKCFVPARKGEIGMIIGTLWHETSTNAVLPTMLKLNF